ncbi:MAG: UDP-4-amino-4,6-dideoxy-N-acetyl-beta-L-altrosamine transaminase [Rhodospirillaceae bacterium]|nr:UDP-4-amino-4,6-dideoxy-N-acetyl-beta-L-altrosamine transaminase [Rhodospirillaceae bacterium]MBT6117632.1 UDP-4-amino-4,6-dideoxy-N-acetyl-beta-L-altrosamine transaminase [Rhodospirillaceae bacterium]
MPYGRQRIEADDIAAVVAVLEGDWLTTGPAVDEFERALGETVDSKYAIACSSGTAALHMAAMALGLGPGKIAIVPSLTFAATANAPRLTGCDVVLADVDPETGLMRPEDFEAALARAPGAAAVFPVHMNGQAVDMAAIGEIARAHGVAIVEDASHALGGDVLDRDGAWRPVGACADSAMTVFSFHPVKTIAMGEGGAVTTNGAALGAALARLRNHALHRDPAAFEARDLAFDADGQPNPWYYELREPGLNYRASDIHCALGRSQLAKLDRFRAARTALAARYDSLLAPLAPLVRPLGRVAWARPCWHLYVALIDFAELGRSRAEVMRALRERGIGSQVHYTPLHLQPYYRDHCGAQHLPGAEAYYARCLSLPLHVSMTEADVDRVVGSIAETIGTAS